MNTLNNTTPMYVGYVLKRYPRFSETFVVNEILAHERVGTKIDIFALGPVEETHFQDGISRVRGPVTRYESKQRNLENLWEAMRKGFAELPNFVEKLAQVDQCNVYELYQAISVALEVKKRGIQHLHAHFGTQATTVARQAARLADITYTFTAHAKDIFFQYEDSTNLGEKMRDSATTITISDYNKAYLQAQYGSDADKVVRIYNGMDLKKFPYAPFEKRERHILAVGRLVPKKGFTYLLQALAILKARGEKMYCTLIGDGKLRDEIAAEITALDIGDVITMVGPMAQPDIIRQMSTANMVVSPCVISDDGDRDGLPTVLLESMALGTPVISTQVVGIPELVKDGETGLCVEAENAEVLADAMIRLLNDHALCKKLSENGRQLIEQEYDEDTNAAKQRDFFAAAINSSKA
ncbi:glycosyltransferase family 4 protein [Actinobacillus vicugnae]|uniref:glycosyltransferase family 4 protein n=1 Tax=Actinobacillus vicugnae TaxID=2573093 RepID=UPI00123F6288|nr:glycosyltransferase family 4 protein [Actinobacillus vicugnae]